MQIYFIVLICVGIVGIVWLMYNLYNLYKEYKSNQAVVNFLQTIIVDNLNEETRERSPHVV